MTPYPRHGYEHVDKLTGLPDRWSWDARAERHLSHARASGADLALLLVDLDRLKLINDTWGHLAGDAVIVAVSDAVRRVIGTTGLACRYGGHGGDEFLVLMPHPHTQGASRAAERIRCGVRDLVVTAPSTSGDHVELTGLSASVGLTIRSGPDLGTMDGLVMAADAALQQAKRHGRNQVCSASERCVQAEPIQDSSHEQPLSVLDHDVRLQHLLNFAHTMRGQWTPDVLMALWSAPRRYTDLLATIRNSTAVDGWTGRARTIETSNLNRTLRRLQRDGLVTSCHEHDGSVRYELTSAACDLIKATAPGVLWSQKHQDLVAQTHGRALVPIG